MAGIEDQRETIAFLSDPASHGGASSVERIDTHIAHIILCGDHALKMKRAVRFPYLDFSTLARRKAVCEAELALNRRTAPDLYLGLRSVNRQVDGTLGWGPGEPVEWLIEMRRFPAEDLLVEVAARGALSPALVRDLADGIAAFHARAEPAPGAAGAACVHDVIVGNARSMAALPDDLLDAAGCKALEQASLAALERISPLLNARAATGHVRHCHGDLHLANICLWQGKPTLFDCLEFDAGLATTDVLYDLAFLLMDLWEKGHCDAAAWLFNRYLDRTDEGGGVAALPLFLSMRAAIRAHVEASRAAGESDPAETAASRTIASDYMALALDVLRPPPPRLIAVGGLSGTGKSTLAGRLAALIGGAPGARWLRTDIMRKRLAGAEPEQHLPPEHYTRAASDGVYDALCAEAAAMLAAGRAVIVDGVFADPDERARIAAVGSRAGCAFMGLWLEAPGETLRARVSVRRGDASDADEAVVALQLERPVGTIAPWHRVDASGTEDETLARALPLIEPKDAEGEPS